MEQQQIDFEGLLKRKKPSKTTTPEILLPDFDTLQQLNFDGDDDFQTEVVVPNSIHSQVEKQIIDEIVENKKSTGSLLGGMFDFLTSTPSKPNNVTEEEKQQVIEVVDDAIKQHEIQDIKDVVVKVRKDKSGYHKLKVTVKGSQELSALASSVKEITNGDVVHRAMDLRNISNTNKNQLKSSEYKLSPKSYVFKSKTSKRKYHRFIVSLQENNEVVVFLQEGAEKYVTKIKFNLDLLTTLISKYFMSGINTTISRLKAFENGEDSEVINLAYEIASTGKYKIKVAKNGFAIKGKEVKHYWLYVAVIKQSSGKYIVYGKSSVEKAWKGYQLLPDAISSDFILKPKFQVLLDDWFDDFNWSGIYDIVDEENNTFNQYKKLRYRKLKNAFDRILELKDDNTELGIEIIKTISREELSANETLGKWQPEAIIGKTNYLDVFALTWSAVAIAGGNSRERKSGNGTYDSRPFMFTLTYQKGNKVEEMLSKDFDELLKSTRFLSNNPVF